MHTVVCFVIPMLYILDGLQAGDTLGAAAATPHVFLLSTQVFIEGIMVAWLGTFSLPIRAAVLHLVAARGATRGSRCPLEVSG